MTFREDLEYFYEDSYGYEINYKQACIMIKDVMEKFDEIVGNSTDNTLYFSHSGTILKLLAFLGIDKPKSHIKHDSNINDRQWSTNIRDRDILNLRQENKLRIYKVRQPNCTSLQGADDIIKMH